MPGNREKSSVSLFMSMSHLKEGLIKDQRVMIKEREGYNSMTELSWVQVVAKVGLL